MITHVKAIEIVTSTLDFLLYRNFSSFSFSKPFPGRIYGTRKGEDILLSTTASCAGNRTRKKKEKTRLSCHVCDYHALWQTASVSKFKTVSPMIFFSCLVDCFGPRSYYRLHYSYLLSILYGLPNKFEEESTK